MSFLKAKLKHDHFKLFLVVSFSTHLLVVALFQIGSLFTSSETIEIKSAMKVDMVALPDKHQNKPKKAAAKKKAEKPKPAPPPKPEPKPEPKAKPKPKPDPKPKVDKKAQQDAFSKLNQADAFSKLDDIKEPEPEENKESDNDASDDKFKGNQILDGNSLSGLDKMEMNAYYNTLITQVQNEFLAPAFLSQKDLRCSVVVQLDERGYVLRRDIESSSGNELFDEAALSAIDRSSPFPTPPERLQKTIARNKIIFRFPRQ